LVAGRLPYNDDIPANCAPRINRNRNMKSNAAALAPIATT
jgi:hypothetical protein